MKKRKEYKKKAEEDYIGARSVHVKVWHVTSDVLYNNTTRRRVVTLPMTVLYNGPLHNLYLLK